MYKSSKLNNGTWKEDTIQALKNLGLLLIHEKAFRNFGSGFVVVR